MFFASQTRNAITTVLNVKYIWFWTPQNRPGGPEAINGPKLPGLPREFDNFLEAWDFGVFWGSKRVLEDVKNSVKSLICQYLVLRNTSFSVSYIIKGSFYRSSIAFCNRLRGRKVVDLGKRLAFCRKIVFYVPKNRPRSPEDINGPSGPPKSPSEPRGHKWAQTARFAMGIWQLFGGLAFWSFLGVRRDSREGLLGVQIYRIPGFLSIQMRFGGPNL